jgi:Protein of unknown function DUF262
MQFEDILTDIEKLVGLTLNSINPATPGVVLIKFDRAKKNYLLQIEGSPKQFTRTVKELADIWNHLVQQGYVNVDQALFGGGSSRNQPETIFANLPYIQHFKYNNKKHLLLRMQATHEPGTQDELSGSELRIIKKLIDKQKNLNISAVNNEFEGSLRQLEKNIQAIQARNPGDQSIKEFESTLFALKKVQQEIESTIVTLDAQKEDRKTKKIVTVEDEIRAIKIEDIIDSPIFTGVDDGQEDSDDDEDTKLDNIGSLSFIEKFNKPNFRRQTPTFSLLYDRLTFNEIEIQPEYQRKDRIWSITQKSKLIESILMGLPLPIFYFGERSNGNWIIIDGLQRITTIQDFMQDKFMLRDFEDTKLNGKKFSDFNRHDVRKIREFEITAYIVDAKEENEKFITELFHRINTFGMKLSHQEIRTAINLGSSVAYLKHLATNTSFINATDNKVNADRQKDLELCLAALAYMLRGYKSYRYGKYDIFLGDAMKDLNRENFTVEYDSNNNPKYSSTSIFLGRLTEKFVAALNFSKEIFGEAAFKKIRYPDKGDPLNKPLFELIISVFSNLTPQQMTLIKTNRAIFFEKFYSAIADDSDHYARWESKTYEDKKRGFDYALSQSTGKRVTVLYRFDSFIKIIEESIGCNITFTPFLKSNNND